MEITKAELSKLSNKLKTYKKKQKLNTHAKLSLFPKQKEQITKQGFIIKVLNETQKIEKFTTEKSILFYDEMMNRHRRAPLNLRK